MTENLTLPQMADGTDPFTQMRNASVVVLTELISQANQAAAVVKAQQNRNAVIADVIESSDDETVQAYRAKVEEAEATMLKWENQITQYVTEHLLPKGDENDVEAAQETYKEKNAAIKSFKATLANLPGGNEELDKLPELNSLGRGSGGTGTGAKRPRVEQIQVKLHDAENWTNVSATQKDAKNPGATKEVVSLTVLAQKLRGEPYGIETSAKELREHAEGEAGDSSTWGDLNGKPFTFALSKGDKHVMVRVTPSAGNKADETVTPDAEAVNAE